jgi:hypothetical protein
VLIAVGIVRETVERNHHHHSSYPFSQVSAASGLHVSIKSGRCSPIKTFDTSITSSSKTKLMPKLLNHSSVFCQLLFIRCLQPHSISSTSSMKMNSTIHIWRFPEKKRAIKSCRTELCTFFAYHENRRKAKENDRFYRNRIFLPRETDLSVAAEKSALHVRSKKLDEYEHGDSWWD